jgi:iron-sulfur cluster assembly protein
MERCVMHVTESALRGLEELLREKGGEGGCLRLAVERGGCAGLQYAMTLGSPQPGDLPVGPEGSGVVVEAASVGHLEGCTLDYSDGLSGAGFRIQNPRAARSCGCGISYEPSA